MPDGALFRNAPNRRFKKARKVRDKEMTKKKKSSAIKKPVDLSDDLMLRATM